MRRTPAPALWGVSSAGLADISFSLLKKYKEYILGPEFSIGEMHRVSCAVMVPPCVARRGSMHRRGAFHRCTHRMGMACIVHGCARAPLMRSAKEPRIAPSRTNPPFPPGDSRPWLLP